MLKNTDTKDSVRNPHFESDVKGLTLQNGNSLGKI